MQKCLTYWTHGWLLEGCQDLLCWYALCSSRFVLSFFPCFEPTCVSHKLPYSRKWMISLDIILIWSFFQHPFVSWHHSTKQACAASFVKFQFPSYSKPSADWIPGALGFRIDQASKQCPSSASHLLISAGGFCPDPRRDTDEPRIVTAGVSSGRCSLWLASICIVRNMTFLQSRWREIFRPPNFVSQQFWLFNSETTWYKTYIFKPNHGKLQFLRPSALSSE